MFTRNGTENCIRKYSEFLLRQCRRWFVAIRLENVDPLPNRLPRNLLSTSTAQTLSEILGCCAGRPSSKRRVESFFPYVVPTSSTRILQTDVVNSLRLILIVARAGTVTNNTLPDISCYTNPWRMPVYKSGLARLRRTRRHRAGATEKVKNPALPGGAFVNQEGICLRFAMGCHSSPLFRAGHPGRSS